MRIVCSCDDHCRMMTIEKLEDDGLQLVHGATFQISIGPSSILLSVSDLAELYNYIEDTGLV